MSIWPRNSSGVADRPALYSGYFSSAERLPRHVEGGRDVGGLFVAQQVDQHRGEAVDRVGGQAALGLEVLGGQRVERPERQRIAVQQHQCRLLVGLGFRCRFLVGGGAGWAHGPTLCTAGRHAVTGEPYRPAHAPPGSSGRRPPRQHQPAPQFRHDRQCVQPIATTRDRRGHDRHPKAPLGQVGKRQRRAGLERDSRGHPGFAACGVELMPDTRPYGQRDELTLGQVAEPDGLAGRKLVGFRHRGMRWPRR